MFELIFNVLKKKYNVILINSKWEIINKNVKLKNLPRQKEYIWDGTKYYQVINLVHDLKNIKQVSIIVEEITNNLEIKKN